MEPAVLCGAVDYRGRGIVLRGVGSGVFCGREGGNTGLGIRGVSSRLSSRGGVHADEGSALVRSIIPLPANSRSLDYGSARSAKDAERKNRADPPLGMTILIKRRTARPGPSPFKTYPRPVPRLSKH